jgi:radical SAM superfamily enzyme YgiQ (UPF0313 family)
MNNLTLIQFQYHSSFSPLGALYLAFGLEKENIHFGLKICPIDKYVNNLNKLYSFLTKSKDILAIGCWSDMLPYVVGALRKLKQNFPKKIIILGGIGPTEAAEEILNEFEFIDFIIKGCGVYLLPKLIKKIRNGCTILDDIDGLVYRYNNAVISNYYKGFYLNIPDFPAYHYINNIQRCSHFGIFTSYGCPYKCTFCITRSVSPKNCLQKS